MSAFLKMHRKRLRNLIDQSPMIEKEGEQLQKKNVNC